MVAKAQRHRQIIKLIESGRISSQFDLAQQLSRVGIDTTQTTLSRDLTEIGVVKSAAGYQVLSAMLASGSETLPVDRIASLTATVRRLLLEVAIGGTQADARKHCSVEPLKWATRVVFRHLLPISSRRACENRGACETRPRELSNGWARKQMRN